MDQPEQNFISWHFNKAIPAFVSSRLDQIEKTYFFFNITGLFVNLFAPYRRLLAKPKETYLDRVSFNLISRVIGSVVRSILILTGILSIAAVIIYELVSILIYFSLPPLSYPKYVSYQLNNFFKEDLEDTQKFSRKLKSTLFFQHVSMFFEEDFKNIFSNIPTPSQLGIKEGQKQNEIIFTLAQKFTALKDYLAQKNIKPDHLKLLLDYLEEHIENPPQAPITPLGQILTYGYTNTLENYSIELTRQYLPALYPRKQILTATQKILERPQNNNVLLVGEPGVGRHTILESLALAIQRSQINSLIGKRIMLLDTIAVAGTGKNLIEVKSRFEAILAEAKHAGNIILAIDNIDRIVSPMGERIDLTEVITATLTDSSLTLIGITTLDEFNEFIRPNATFLKYFEKVDVEEASPEETITILIGKSQTYLKRENIATTLPAILELVEKSSKLIAERKQPDKGIILLQDCVAEAKGRKLKLIVPTLVDEVIAQIAKIPIGKITEKESQKLTNLEAILHKRIVGQDEAIVQISKALRRARAEIETDKRPIGSFLFLGPTGVGKTETAKALAQTYFGSEERMIRIDMSEFHTEQSIERLIGNAQTKMPGQLVSLVRQYPFSLLLVDEFEKATTQVHNLFLQILEEGFLTDAFGKKVSFKNIIIIATSNAAAEYIREQVAKMSSQLSVDPLRPRGEASSSQKEKTMNYEPLTPKLIEYVLQKGFFAPELINRFDAVVVYRPLNPKEALEVTILMLQKLEMQLKNTKNITLEITTELAQKIAQAGYDPTFGARPIRRLIADRLEDGIAKMIIGSQVRNGDTIPATTLLGFVS